ncbi:hypothetical protein HPB51_009860 [Rhipicephalus microplus]|uniref:Uncharacterized protein n=1 Tax=Rhipicephalus microplus TaxID=6941 RepID=A0A9J6ESB5_RHIMP|nr:hypothetical protein HPB51_009860 [Rhipicephalus microplus]
MRPLWQTTVTSSEDDGGLLRSIWLRKSREANTGDNFSREKRKRAPPKSREMPSPQEPVLDEAAEVSPLQTSPPKEWYKQKVHESAKEVQQLKKKVKTLHQKKRRLSKRIDASQDLIEQLKEQNLLSEKGAVSLAESPTAVTSHRRSSLLEPVDDEHDYTHRVDLPQSLSAVTSAVVPYIAGFVARKVDLDKSAIDVAFRPTIPHCSMATLIGLAIRVKLLRCLPPVFKVAVRILPGTHVSESATLEGKLGLYGFSPQGVFGFLDSQADFDRSFSRSFSQDGFCKDAILLQLVDSSCEVSPRACRRKILKHTVCIPSAVHEHETTSVASLAVKIYDIPVSAEQARAKLREEYLKNKHVRDIRAIDLLVIKGQMELVETLSIFKQKSHVMNYFKETVNPKPTDFMSKFLAGY